MKGISTEDFPENCVGRLSNNSRQKGADELFLRVIQQICLGGLSNRFYQNSVVSFQEQKLFVLKIVFFFSHIWLRHV